jgi:hypothetical protein
MMHVEPQRTPGLDVQYDYRLRGDLGLGLLLLTVLGQTLLADAGGLSILLFLVAAEQVDIVVVLLSRRGLGRVQSGSDDVGTVDGIRLSRITGKRCEFVIVTSDVLVPTRSMRVLGSLRGSAQGLEDGHIGLGRRVAIDAMSQWEAEGGGIQAPTTAKRNEKGSEMQQSAC